MDAVEGLSTIISMGLRVKILGLAGLIVAGSIAFHSIREYKSQNKPLSASVRPASYGSVPAEIRSLRPVYPYSVLPGGVFSAQELRDKLAGDTVARAHYAGFDASRARLVTVSEDRLQYVSYRKDGQIYWTKNKLRIPKGEVLLTDGNNFARGRCGNRLSDTPQTRVLSKEPTAAIGSGPMPLVANGSPNLGFVPHYVSPLVAPKAGADAGFPDQPAQGGSTTPASKQQYALVHPPGGISGFGATPLGGVNKRTAVTPTGPIPGGGNKPPLPPPVITPVPEPGFTAAAGLLLVYGLCLIRRDRRQVRC